MENILIFDSGNASASKEKRIQAMNVFTCTLDQLEHVAFLSLPCMIEDRWPDFENQCTRDFHAQDYFGV